MKQINRIPQFITFLFLISIQIKGQITGIVKNTKNEPVPFVNVLLLNAKDSVLIKGAITNETGGFLIETVDIGAYKILLFYTGYVKYYSESFVISDFEKSKLFGSILIEESAINLKDVNILYEKPFIERKLDRTVINIENSIVASGNDALEVLKQAPGVSVDNNDNISLKGKAGVSVLIDGKSTNLSPENLGQMLKGMSASQISKIEIITNPSAKYDAAGNSGIINIVLRKNNMFGFNGQINGAFSQAFYAKENAGIECGYRNKKWAVFGSYNYNHYKGMKRIEITKNFKNNGLLENKYQQNSTGDLLMNANSGKISIDFSPNSKHTIGFISNLMYSDRSLIRTNQTSIYDGKNKYISGSETSSSLKSPLQNTSFNINYLFKIDSTGKELSFNVDYANFKNKLVQNYNTNYLDHSYSIIGNPYILKTAFPLNVDVKSAKVDYIHPIGSKIRVELGLKSSLVNTDNDSRFWQVVNNSDSLLTNRTNHFIYSENVNAGYLNYNQSLKKNIDFQLGLRCEQTIANGNQITTSVKDLKFHYC